MYLLPESIRNDVTIGLDKAWETRLMLLRYNNLKIDLSNETDQQKLLMWLEMFGISVEDIPSNLSTQEYQNLLKHIILIFKISGTRKSIELLCHVLGAESVTFKQDFSSFYNGEINYQGNFRYDGGASISSFVMSLSITGVNSQNQVSFETKLRRFFEIFQPAWLWLKEISFL